MIDCLFQQPKMLAITLLLLGLSCPRPSIATSLLFSTAGSITVSVPAGSATVAGFDMYGIASPPTRNIYGMQEQDETAFSYVALSLGTISALNVFGVVTATLPQFGSQTAPGAINVQYVVRHANLSSPFNDTILSAYGTYGPGTFAAVRVQATDNIDEVSLQIGDRITVQTRLQCLTCVNDVILSIALTASIYLAQQTCPDLAVCVSTVTGSDVLGSRGGLPFMTLVAALNAAHPGDACILYPGSYQGPITIPTNVNIRGTSQGVSIIQALNVLTATDLVTMGVGSQLNDVTLSLTSSLHVQLRGVVFSGLSASTAVLRNVVGTVNNSAANTTGTSTVIGVFVNGTAQTSETFTNVINSAFTVSSNGLGTKRPIQLALTTASVFVVRATTFVTSPNTTTSASYIAGETTTSFSTLRTYASSFTGSPIDISETAGVLAISGTLLGNSNANGLAFTLLDQPAQFSWSTNTGLTVAALRYWTPGFNTAVSSATIMSYAMPQAAVISQLNVFCNTVGNGAMTVNIVKNGVITGLTTTLAAAAQKASDLAHSVTFAAGDLLSLQTTPAGTTFAGDIIITVVMY
jgi:hypothetical protein